ncbi:hypothetical protein PQX77_003954 [Marasmius sp. AFHP31]|nr:hypothetical protein PQX77_003954 [Marasmius sp. AFHP31]
MLLLRILFCALSPWLFSPFNPFAKTVTRYIDDSYGDLVTGSKPEYHPTDSTVWQNQSCGTVQGCRIAFDTQKSYNGTYTAATYRSEMNTMGFSLSFQGTSIAVYFILANGDYDPSTITRTECDFILDGLLEGSYAWDQPPNKTGPEYNVEVFRKEGLENRLHALKVETGTKTQDVYIAFDYATYTVEEPDENIDSRNGSNPSPSKGVPTGTIVGSVIGGIAFIVSALLVLLMCRKRHNSPVKRNDGSGKRTVLFMGHLTPFNPHQTDTTPYPRAFGGIPVPSPPVASKAKLPITRATSHAFDTHRNAGDTISESEALSSSTDGRSLSSISTSGPYTKASDSLLSQQFGSTREEWSSVESRGRPNYGDNYTLSDSGTGHSGIIQAEMSELREQIRELKALVLRR